MIHLTPVASSKVKEIMNMQSPVPTALRVAVVGGGCSGFQYHMAFENQTSDADQIFEFDGLTADACASEPASIVRELLPLLPSGPALDIACGSGRHTLLLAARGQHVTAVDWSGAALGILETRARSAGLALRRIPSLDRAARSSRGGVALMQADLEDRKSTRLNS